MVLLVGNYNFDLCSNIPIGTEFCNMISYIVLTIRYIVIPSTNNSILDNVVAKFSFNEFSCATLTFHHLDLQLDIKLDISNRHKNISFKARLINKSLQLVCNSWNGMKCHQLNEWTTNCSHNQYISKNI